MSFLHHESLARTADAMARLQACRVTVCGAGALGANVTETLARSGFAHLRVIDRDRIEERNLSTQPWYRSDVGAPKATILANALFRALKLTVDAQALELTPRNAARLLRGSDLVIDTFDNSVARQAVQDCCRAEGIPCLHAGLATGYAEILWDADYRVPSAAQDDVCDYPLARTLVLLTVAVTCEAIVAYLVTGHQRAHTITLSDLTIHPVP